MRGALFRPRLWIAGAILGLTLAGACNLNPQPLPPESDQNGSTHDASSPQLGPTSSSGSGDSSGPSDGSFASSSGGGSNSGSSSGATGSPADAGAIAEQAEDGVAAVSLDGGTDAGPASDSGFDSGTDGASPDAALDDASTGDAGCVRPLDCYVSHPGACSICTWPLSYPVCVEHQCRCACERDAAGE